MSKRVKISLGDIVCIPIDDERVGYAQIVAAEPYTYYFAAFERAYPRSNPPDIDDLVTDRVALLGIIMTTRIKSGDWPIVGNATVTDKVIFPAYKEAAGSPHCINVVDYTCRRSRRATDAEAERLPYRATCSPMVLQHAMQAKHGVVPWEEFYDQILPIDQSMSSEHFFD